MQRSSEFVGGYLFKTLENCNRVTVVKFGVVIRGSDGTGCFRIKVRTDAKELTDMRISGHRK